MRQIDGYALFWNPTELELIYNIRLDEYLN